MLATSHYPHRIPVILAIPHCSPNTPWSQAGHSWILGFEESTKSSSSWCLGLTWRVKYPASAGKSCLHVCRIRWYSCSCIWGIIPSSSRVGHFSCGDLMLLWLMNNNKVYLRQEGHFCHCLFAFSALDIAPEFSGIISIMAYLPNNGTASIPSQLLHHFFSFSSLIFLLLYLWGFIWVICFCYKVFDMDSNNFFSD